MTDRDLPPPRFVIEGSAITGIAAFYDEINRVFMAGEDWRLGESLDAFDDLLHGGFGALPAGRPATIVWKDMDASRAALGRAATLALLRARLPERTQFNGAKISDQIAELEAGRGTTYFDVVMAIVADHPAITVVPG
ncbi:barstar family protein [Novosphingobium soli]|uniref:Barstar family protein n=1 Tax=Novosphingobium soli TaxID=574956 RepID=A0ABV6CX05_9SPHN